MDMNSKIGISDIVYISPVILSAAFIVNAYVLDMAGLLLNLPLLFVLVAVEFIVLGYVLKDELKGFRFKTGYFEFAASTAVFAGFLVMAYQFSSDSPLQGGGVDPVHHFLLADYILSSRHIVHEYIPSLGWDMSYYPFGVHLVMASVSIISGIDIFFIMSLFAAVILSLVAVSTYLVAARLLPEESPVYKAVPLLVLFATFPLNYFIDTIHSGFYLAMVFGEICFMTAALLLVFYWNFRSRLFIVLLVFTVSALCVSYTIYVPVIFAAFGLIILALNLTDKIGLRKMIVDSALFYIPTLAVMLMFLNRNFGGGVGIIHHEGGTTIPTFHVIGYFFIILSASGLAVSFKRWREILPLQILTILTILMVAVLLFLKVYIDFGSFYIIYKMAYLLILPLSVFSSIAVGWGLDRTKGLLDSRMSKGAHAVVMLLTFSLMAYKIGVFRLRMHTPLNSSEYITARWVQKNLKTDELAYIVDSGMKAYWINNGVIKNPRDGTSTKLLNGLMPSYEKWLGDPYEYPTAVTDNITAAESNPSVRVLFRSGKSGVVQKKNMEFMERYLTDTSFESFGKEGSDWVQKTYSSAISAVADEGAGRTGSVSVRVSSPGGDGGVAQIMKLRKSRTYRISGWAKTQGVENLTGYGAFIGLEGMQGTMLKFSPGTHGWEYREFLFSPQKDDTFTVVIGIGGWGISKGTVWFDDIEVSAVK